MIRRSSILVLAALAACTPKRVHEEPVLAPGDRVPSADAAVEAARGRTVLARTEAEGRRDALAAEALTSCAPEVCAAIARGEVMLGMTEAQVMAATGTTEAAWRVRDAGAATIMLPASAGAAVRDGTGELAMLQLHNGLVSTYSYRESQGIRVVSRPQDATTRGRAGHQDGAVSTAKDPVFFKKSSKPCCPELDHFLQIVADDMEMINFEGVHSSILFIE